MPHEIFDVIVGLAELAHAAGEGAAEMPHSGPRDTSLSHSVARRAALYQEQLLAEYRAPKNRRAMPDATRRAERKNPTCGDTMNVAVRLDADRVLDAAFEGQGCSISLASASLMTQVVTGLSIGDARIMIADVESMLSGAPSASLPSTLEPLRTVMSYKTRHGCLLMPWLALRAALA